MLACPIRYRVSSTVALTRACNALATGHIVDGAGWPLCINSTRRICEQHAYLDPWGTPATYSEAQLRHIVDFATARGVRVMVEFDLPGEL